MNRADRGSISGSVYVWALMENMDDSVLGGCKCIYTFNNLQHVYTNEWSFMFWDNTVQYVCVSTH